MPPIISPSHTPLYSEKMNCDRLRDQFSIMGGRHREELTALQRQHGTYISMGAVTGCIFHANTPLHINSPSC